MSQKFFHLNFFYNIKIVYFDSKSFLKYERLDFQSKYIFFYIELVYFIFSRNISIFRGRFSMIYPVFAHNASEPRWPARYWSSCFLTGGKRKNVKMRKGKKSPTGCPDEPKQDPFWPVRILCGETKVIIRAPTVHCFLFFFFRVLWEYSCAPVYYDVCVCK